MPKLFLALPSSPRWVYAVLALALLLPSVGRAQNAPPPPPGYTQEEWDVVKEHQKQQIEAEKKASSLKENSIPAQSPPAPPPADSSKVKLCNQPTLSAWNGIRRYPIFYFRWKQDPSRDLGSLTMDNVVDMTAACNAKPFARSVRNETPVHIYIWQDLRAECEATVTYGDDPVKDYGSVFLALLSPQILGNIKTIIKPETQQEPEKGFATIDLPAEHVKDTTATVTISCSATQVDPGKPIALGVEQKILIHYGSVDLFSGSTGAIVSALGKKNYGVVTTDTTNKNADGTPITSSVIGVTSTSNAQFVPMGFINWNYSGDEKLNLNLQFGIGINPNGSSTQVEYFLSPLALSFHHIYIAPGVHIAQSQRIANGFQFGEAVPSGFSLPTTYRTTYRFGVTVSIKPYK